ncbi:hypothetical protein [Actinacidiphila epipremni]|uniref:hypothetical protein n=1 Tax=Actinacidiphila epipremni TaxID=2053013 RepID=UPI002AFEEAE3|nr:hypothetical protein [Actinacidiphila epipremni]
MPPGSRGRRGRAADPAPKSAPDPQAELRDLHTTWPGDFVARRAELAAAAKQAGRTEDAKGLRAARRPTLAAWALNVLAAARPEESRRFRELGASLREAHRTLDAEQLRSLSAQQWKVVAGLAREAAGLAAQAGHPLTDSVLRDVEGTLRAVLADQDAADLWADGRLASTLSPPTDLPAAEPGAGGTSPGRRTRPSGAPPPKRRAGGGRTDELAQQRRKKAERARGELRAAERRLADARGAHEQAEAALAAAREQTQHADAAVETAEADLRAAREARAAARRDEGSAEKARTEAGDALHRAEQQRADATRAVERTRT